MRNMMTLGPRFGLAWASDDDPTTIFNPLDHRILNAELRTLAREMIFVVLHIEFYHRLITVRVELLSTVLGKDQ